MKRTEFEKGGDSILCGYGGRQTSHEEHSLGTRYLWIGTVV